MVIRFIPVLIAILFVGCGKKEVEKGISAEQFVKDQLADLGQFLKDCTDQNRPPPSKQADLDAVEAFMPNAGPALRSGDIVFLWGNGYMANSSAIVAYEKKAPIEGGAVLLQNGIVQTMSASEFQSAAKASKK